MFHCDDLKPFTECQQHFNVVSFRMVTHDALFGTSVYAIYAAKSTGINELLKKIRVRICKINVAGRSANIVTRANLYSSESLYKGRPAAQDSTVLRIRIKRWSLRPFLLCPASPCQQEKRFRNPS